MNGNAGALGIDIGGTKICLALVSRERGLMRSMRFPTELALKDKSVLPAQAEAFLGEEEISCIGIGLKGMVLPDNRTILSSSILSGLLPWDVCGTLEERFRVPCRIDNDVHAAALGEKMFGLGRTSENFVYVNVGTGLAMAIVSGGRLIRGRQNIAGEIGLSLARCGDEVLPLEDIASGQGMALRAQALLDAYPDSCLRAQQRITGRAVVDAALRGDALAECVLAMVTQALSEMVFNLTVMLDPEMFVFGGGVMSDGRIFQRVSDTVGRMSAMAHRTCMPPLRLTSLGSDTAGVVGAAAVGLTYFDADEVN